MHERTVKRMAKYSDCVCGSRSLLKHRVLTRRWYEKKWFIECDHCHFCAKSAYTEKGAIRKWNKAMSIAKAKDGDAEDDP